MPEDEPGNAYEYLIKKFADDSGHTAAEFYTNRTVVRLMTQLLDPQEGESIYDPTTGSGGMLLSAAMQLKRQGKDWRTLRLYGQERNLITSAIARMNELEVFWVGQEPRETQGWSTVQVSESSHPWMANWWPQGHIIGWEHTFVHEVHHLLDCIVNDKPVAPFGATFEDGYRAAVVCDGILESAASRAAT